MIIRSSALSMLFYIQRISNTSGSVHNTLKQTRRLAFMSARSNARRRRHHCPSLSSLISSNKCYSSVTGLYNNKHTHTSRSGNGSGSYDTFGESYLNSRVEKRPWSSQLRSFSSGSGSGSDGGHAYNNDDDNGNNISNISNDGNNNESDDEIKNKTNKWIENVVIGLNLCPFAERSLSKSQIFTNLVRGDDIQEIASTVLYESMQRQDEVGTTVVVCPDLSPLDFNGYLDVAGIINELLEDTEVNEDIQIAPFHPLFQFEGSDSDDIENFTNRSPYPIFHILREKEVESAVKKLDGDSSKVFQRNIDLLGRLESTLGREGAEKVMRGEKVEGLVELLKTNRDG